MNGGEATYMYRSVRACVPHACHVAPAHKVTVLLFTHSKLAMYLGVVFVIAAKTQLFFIISLEIKSWISNMMRMFVLMPSPQQSQLIPCGVAPR